MYKYYKATILLSTEELWKNPETGDYEGCDPGTFQDRGVIYEFTGSLESIKDQIKKTLSNVEAWEYCEVNQCLEWSCEGEHDCRTPVEERIPFIENWYLYLTEVEETSKDTRELLEPQKIEFT